MEAAPAAVVDKIESPVDALLIFIASLVSGDWEVQKALYPSGTFSEGDLESQTTAFKEQVKLYSKVESVQPLFIVEIDDEEVLFYLAKTPDSQFSQAIAVHKDGSFYCFALNIKQSGVFSDIVAGLSDEALNKRKVIFIE